MNIESEKTDFLNLMVITTTLMKNYDACIDSNDKIKEHFDVKTNSMCTKLKSMYCGIDDKVVQCIASSYMIYLLISICNGFDDYTNEKNMKNHWVEEDVNVLD